MKEITKIGENVYHVISEPGDMTRYEYIVYRDGPDEFTFAPARSVFNFPQRLSYQVAKCIHSDRDKVSKEEMKILSKIADMFKCNPNAVLECTRTVKELWEGKVYRKAIQTYGGY